MADKFVRTLSSVISWLTNQLMREMRASVDRDRRNLRHSPEFIIGREPPDI